MLNAIIRLFLSKRILGLFFALGIIGLGLWSFRELPIDAYPDISTTQVQVIYKAPGMTPLEVEKRITYPIEIAVKGIPRQTVLRSLTKYALSIVTIDFEEGTDIYWARQQVAERLTSVTATLPPGVDGGLAPITSPLSEVYMFLVEGNGYSSMELREVLDWMIRPRLLSIDGVADVNSLGGEVKSIEVRPFPLKLEAMNFSLHQIEEAILANNANVGGDRVISNDEVILVRTNGQLDSIEDVRNIVVASRNGRPIRLHELAEVEYAAMTRFGGVTVNGKGEGVQGIVLLRRGANGQETVEAVKGAMARIKKSLPGGVKITPFYDRTELIEKAVWTVESSLGQAIVLVLIVLFLFLGNFWSALSAGIILPISVLGSFLLMYLFNISANLMSLGGLAISIGILVDSAVVVVENVHTFLGESTGRVHKLNIVFRATKEVALPVVSAVIIIIASLFPIFMLTGIEGKLFKPLAVTLAFALLVAMVVSLTVIPVAASFLMKHRKDHKDSRLLGWMLRVYKPSLGFVLRHPKKSVAVSAIVMLGSFMLFPLIGKEFLPVLNEGTMVVQTENTPSISLTRALRDNTRLQKALMALPEIDGVVSRTGSDELGLDPMGFFQSDNYIVYAPRSKWKVKNIDELKEKMRKIIKSFPGIQEGFTQPIDMRVSEILTGVRAALAIKLYGDSLDVLEKKGAEIEDIIKKVRGSTDVIRTPLKGQQYLSIAMNKRAMGCHGVAAATVNHLIRNAVGGTRVTEMYKGNVKIPVTVRFPLAYRNSIEAIGALKVPTPSGGSLPLRDLTHMKQVDGPLQISREDGKRQVVIQCNVEGRDIVGFVSELKQKIANEVTMPSGYFVTFGGQFENQQRATKRILVTVPAAILLIFVLLFLIFKSARQSMLIMGTIPLSFIGGIVLLYLSGFYLSISASIGFIALFGIAVENSIVLINYINQLRQTGATVKEAVVTGAVKRLRPVLMTAILTMLGLVPILFATGPGSEIQKPLAVVVFGGVFSSMVLTLLILPALYKLIEEPKSEREKERVE